MSLTHRYFRLPSPFRVALCVLAGVLYESVSTPSFSDEGINEENKEDAIVPQAATQEHTHANRLIHETSPYLLQHAHNPVDWYPWGQEALTKATNEDKPIFLSIGYSACHWCHVMEHESFEDKETATFLNDHFINIKVDREERPDLDEIYMTAVQIMTGSGGWPMTVFLTPDLKPFYGGTYFPPVSLYGRPSFRTVLESIAQAWAERRDTIFKSAAELTNYVQKAVTTDVVADTASFDIGVLDTAIKNLTDAFDPTYGGFGGAPKFPSSAGIEFLLRAYRRTGNGATRDMAAFTLRKMAEGGIYDHAGGGFHRYAVDDHWLVPHFEKMLYDNGQLAQVYLHAYQALKEPLFRRVAVETLDYVLRDMTDPLGGFHSSENADSEGEEGKFYIWTERELMTLLGQDDGYLFCSYYNARSTGNFQSHEKYHQGKNILHVTKPAESVAKQFGIELAAFETRLASMRTRVLAERGKRIRPSLDDKVLASWNGLMVSAFALGFQVTEDTRYRLAAEKAAGFVLDAMVRDGVLQRSYREGKTQGPAYLDDYSFMITALLDLYEATFDEKWMQAAITLAETMVNKFWDTNGGGFFMASQDHANLIVRTKPTYDGAEPSGNSTAALALMRLGAFLGRTDFSEMAFTVLNRSEENMQSSPRGFLKMLCAADFYFGDAKEVALVGDPNSESVRGFIKALNENYSPNKVVGLLNTSNASARKQLIPLLDGKQLVSGQPAAYVCRQFACQAPVTAVQDLLAAIQAPKSQKGNN